MRHILSTLAGIAAGLGVATAAPVTVLSYDTINGETGSFNYWDDTYDGAGSTTTNRAPLSGGTGDLTDGIVAMTGWFAAESPPGAGPYVGWLETFVDITFRFAPSTTLNSMSIWFDDSDGAGGVDHIDRIDVLDTSTTFNFGDPAGNTFGMQTINLGGLVTDTLTVRLFGASGWIFVSEIAFDGRPADAAVPLPAGALLLGGAVPFILRRRKRRA